MKASIDARYYREAGAFVTTEQSRYTLSVIRLEPHPKRGVIIVATNGHTMGIFHDVKGKCDEPFNLFWKEWVSSVCLDGRRLVVNDDRSVDVIRATQKGGVHAEVAEARFLDLIADAPDILFPDWRTVLPDPCTTPALSFNPQYLVACGLDNPGWPIEIFANNNESQTVVTADGRDDFVGIVMPCRDATQYPSKFLNPLRAAKTLADVKH